MAIAVRNIRDRREVQLVGVKVEQIQMIEDVHGKASSAILHPAGRARASPTTPIRAEEAQRPWRKVTDSLRCRGHDCLTRGAP